MSSNAFASIEFELHRLRAALGLFVLWVGVALFWVWQSSAPFSLKAVLTAVALLIALSVALVRLFNLSRGSLSHLSLEPNGGWRLQDGRGHVCAARLIRFRTAPWGHAFLSWQAAPGRVWGLVARNTLNKKDFRRLRVRMRFS